MGLPIGRRHGTRSDASLEASGSRDATNGSLLHYGGGGGSHGWPLRRWNLLGDAGGGWRKNVLVLIDEGHASDVRELAGVIAER